MTDEEKRVIARKLFPHLAWELSGIEIREIHSINPNFLTKPRRKVEIEDVIQKLRSLEYDL